MFLTFSNKVGWQFVHDNIAQIPTFHNLMMKKDGDKKMKLIFDCYHLFSPNGDIEDEKEREKKVGKEIWGEEFTTNLLRDAEYATAKHEFKKMQYDVDVEQYRSVESAIGKLIKQRDRILTNETIEVMAILSQEDINMVESITKTLKLLQAEKEELLEKLSLRVKKGEFTKGKTVGNKNASWLQMRNMTDPSNALN